MEQKDWLMIGGAVVILALVFLWWWSKRGQEKQQATGETEEMKPEQHRRHPQPPPGQPPVQPYCERPEPHPRPPPSIMGTQGMYPPGGRIPPMAVGAAPMGINGDQPQPRGGMPQSGGPASFQINQ